MSADGPSTAPAIDEASRPHAPVERHGVLRRQLAFRPVQAASLVAVSLLMVAFARGSMDRWLVGVAGLNVLLICLLERAPSRQRAPAENASRAGESHILAETLLANIPDPIILVDGRALVTSANDAARALLPNLKVAQPLSFALRAPNVLSAVDKAATVGKSFALEHLERVPIPRTFEVLIGPLKLKDGHRGRASGVILFMREVTSARRSEQMRADFVANVSHELRTPLASVLGFIETLQGAARDDRPARARFLDIMHVQASRMARLIDDLLSLSRIESRAHIRPETPIDLRQVVAQIVDTSRPLAQAEGVEITVEAGAGPLVVPGDRDELLRLVENLVGNAIKYGGSGGRVEVRLARSAKEPMIELSVRDYGPGIAPEHLPRLTERFYRVDPADSRQRGGTGLGLSIIKHVANRHRGRLEIASELNAGATFRVTLPAHTE